MDDEGAIEQLGFVLDGGADHEHGTKRLAGPHKRGNRILDRPEQRVLEKQIVIGVGREAKLGKDGKPRSLRRDLFRQLERLLDIAFGRRDVDDRRARRHAQESVRVDRIEGASFGHDLAACSGAHRSANPITKA